MSNFTQAPRNNNLIDVNQNDGLLSSSYRSTKDKQVVELQEQIKAYKKELTKKDELITHLSTITPQSENAEMQDAMLDPAFPKDKKSKYNIFDMDSPHAELAAAKIKIENTSAENRELRSNLEVKENEAQEMKAKVQLFKENDARQSVLIQTLKEELQHSKQQSAALEQITAKGGLTIQTLQSENREAQEKIIELEAKLRNSIQSAEDTAGEADVYKRKYYDTVVAMGEVLETDTEEGRRENVVDMLVSKVKHMSQEQLLLQSRVQTLDDALSAHSLETKASRETIMRLVSEVGKEQKNIDEISNALEREKVEKEEVLRERDSFAREVDLLKSRLEANDKTWASSREEMSQTATKAMTLTEEVKRLEQQKNETKYELRTFCESLAKVLSNPFVEVPPRENAIKERIQELTIEDRDRITHAEQLEAKIRELSADLEKQQNLHQNSVRQIKSSEKSAFQKENHLLNLDELASGDVIRDTLRRDKTKYLAFLQEMSEAMKMEEVVADLGYDFNTDVLVARAHQLAKLESDALVEKTSSNYNLQRKVKSMKEESKNRDMHMELLRKKIGQLEEKNKSRNNIALDRDDAIVTVQRLHRKVERLQHALGDERVKVGQLKAELAEIHQLKTVTFEQRKKIDELVNSVGKLSSSKERQRQKLCSLKRNMSATELTSDDRNARLEAQLETLGKEFKANKMALDEVTRREKQLVDFRDVVARILGLDVATLSVPDYEVISRLEKLIRNQHIGAAASATLDNSLGAMNYPFRAGYEGGSFRPPSPSRYHTPSPPQAAREYESSGPNRHYRRSRSSSPKRY